MTEKLKQTLKDSAAMRWVVMIMVSGLMFGTYWFQDFFSGLKTMMESQMGITSTQFGTLIGLTTIANIFGMIIIGGIIIDKWGVKVSGVLYGAVATLGAAITALGASDFFTTDPDSKLPIMIVGRILFGVGLEVSCVVVLRAIVKWFKGYELALAMAISMAIGRLGSAMGIALSPDIGGGVVQPAITFAATLIGIGLIMYIVYILFDVKLDRQMKDKAKGVVVDEDKFRLSDFVNLITNKSFWLIALLCVAFYSAVFPFIQYAADMLVNKFNFTYTLPDSAPKIMLFGSNALGNAVIFIGLFIFGIAFSLVPSKIKKRSGKILSILIMAVLFVGFIFLLKDTLEVWIKNGPKVASLIPLGTILFTPIFGNMVDKKGKAASVMILGALLLIFAHISLSVFDVVALGYLGLLSLGVAFSLLPAAMWPSVSKIVKKNQLGTAYATMFTIQNWGLGAFFWGIGKVLDLVNPEVVARIQEIRSGLEARGLPVAEINQEMERLKALGQVPDYNYTIPILMLVVLGVVSIFLAFQLKKSDRKHGYGLELPSSTEKD